MIISIEDRLDYLHDELKSLGYEVYWLSDRRPCDVVVYSGSSTHLTSVNENSIANGNGGVFLINGDGKTSFEIDNMIKHKSYSSLF